jgi:hypothetical protein
MMFSLTVQTIHNLQKQAVSMHDVKTESDDDYTTKVKKISTDMKNLKRSLDTLNEIKQSSSSEIVRMTLRKKRMDLIQTREFPNAILEHINSERVQGMRAYHG